MSAEDGRIAEVVVGEEVVAPKTAAEVGSCRKSGGIAGGVGQLVCVDCVVIIKIFFLGLTCT